MQRIKSAKKSLGQNFLIDNNIVNKIIKIVNFNQNTKILEIGPGYGNLTKKILENNPKKIFAIEKDKKLSFFLKDFFLNQKNIEIINQDILKVINNKKWGNDITVLGNLPYNISTKILTSLILVNKWPPWYNNLILMFQKEVADRIVAKNGTKDFGRLSVLCNWRLDIKKHFDISKNCFYPKPKVDSTVLSFKPKKNILYNIKKPKNLETITRILFSNRRKMINKNFFKLFRNNHYVAQKLNLNLNKRPEELTNEIFYKITIMYEKLFS